MTIWGWNECGRCETGLWIFYFLMAATAFMAASSRFSAAVIGRPLSVRILLASWTLVPGRNKETRLQQRWLLKIGLTRLKLRCHLQRCQTIVCERRRVPLEESVLMMTDGWGYGWQIQLLIRKQLLLWTMSQRPKGIHRECVYVLLLAEVRSGSRWCMIQLSWWETPREWERHPEIWHCKALHAELAASWCCTWSSQTPALNACHNTGQGTQYCSGWQQLRGAVKEEGEDNLAKKVKCSRTTAQKQNKQMFIWYLLISHREMWCKEKAICNSVWFLNYVVIIFF